LSEQKTPTRADVIAMRREAVAAMRARGLSLRQIRENLKKLDPPIEVSHGTISRDVQIIRAEWKQKATESIDEWIASELADLDELEKQAWREKRYDLILKIKDRRAKLLGLDKPMRTELTGADGAPVKITIRWDGERDVS